MSALEEHEHACNPPPRNVTFNSAILRVIGGLSMQPVISQFMADLGCALTEFVPNVYKIFVGMMALWAKYYNGPPRLEDFVQFYSLKSSLDQQGLYYVYAHDTSEKIVNRLPTSQKKGKGYFFWVEWDFWLGKCSIAAEFLELGAARTFIIFMSCYLTLMFLVSGSLPQYYEHDFLDRSQIFNLSESDR